MDELVVWSERQEKCFVGLVVLRFLVNEVDIFFVDGFGNFGM